MEKQDKIDLTGKVGVITGGSKGMGFAIAESYLRNGGSVAILDVDSEALGKAEKDLSNYGKVLAIECDVSKSNAVELAAQQIISAFGKINSLANSAGIQRYGTVVDTPEDVWDDVMNINLKGIFLTGKFIIPEIAKQGGGSVVNLASVQSYASQTGVAAYTASKGAILALTRAMALDHAEQNIRVNAICPASVDTPMLRWAADLWKGDKSAEDILEAWGKGHPIGRVGRAEEIGALASFLASDLCTFMTGADLKVDGGVLSKLGIILPD